MLNRIKKGSRDSDILKYLDGLDRPLNLTSGITPTRLYTHRKTVEQMNQEEFKKLKYQEYTFNAVDGGSFETANGFHIRNLTKYELDDHCKSLYPSALYPVSNKSAKIFSVTTPRSKMSTSSKEHK